MAEESADPTELFQTLLGEVSEEQWESYKELKRVRGDLVCSDSSDASSEPESRTDSPSLEYAMDDMVLNDEEASGSDSAEEVEKQPTSLWESGLTVKYIDGELSFAEFAEIMETAHNKELLKPVPEYEDDDIGENLDTKIEEHFEAELQNLKKKRRKKRVGRLPKDLQGLMGEANLCFARGDQNDAIKMCMEVIRLAPRAHEPFLTLAMIYEDMGETDKAFQFSLIAAYLNPRDPEEWIRLAEMSLERENFKQAISCYSQAIHCDPKNINLHWERCNLYEQLGDKKKALIGYEAILELLGSDQNEECIQLSRELAKIHHENGDDTAAAQILEKAAAKCSSLITFEDINMLLELQMAQKLYEKALMILWQHCGVTFHDPEQEIKEFTIESLPNVQECKTPETLHIDLQIKLAVCLIHLEALPIVSILLTPLFQENPEEMGDLYLDVAEAYMAIGDYQKAIPIFDILLGSKNYSLAAVWLRYAECMNATGNIEAAVKAYEKVVTMAPMHHNARMSHSTLLQQLGRTEEAIMALKQCYEEGKPDIIDVTLLYMRCNLLAGQDKWEEYIKEAKILLSSICYFLQKPLQIQAVFLNQTVKRRLEALKDIERKFVLPKKPTFVNATISPEDLWKFYLKVVNKLFELKKMEELQIVTLQAMTSTVFFKQLQKHKEVEFHALLACYYNRNIDYAYLLAKELVFKEVNRPRVWNLFAQVVMLSQTIRHNRFCLRLTFKHQDHIALGLLNGHNAMVAGSYKHALGEYMGIFKQMPDDPFAILCIGLVFVQIASQKFTTNRHSVVVQACAFLNLYRKRRGECQESYYNMGRAMHSLGLLHLAVHCYKKALEYPPAIDTESETFDLRAEISYNLSLIYRSSGADNVALVYLKKYCVI